MSDLEHDAAVAAASTHARLKFDTLTIFLHWLTLILVLAQFATAWSIGQVGDPGLAKALLTAHRSTGLALWALIVFRLGWRWTGMRAPPLPPQTATWHATGVRVSEYGLYALLLMQPLTGLADTVLRGRSFDLLIFHLPAFMERNGQLAKQADLVHEAGAWLLTGAIALHAGAALFHQLVLKDGVASAMTPILRHQGRDPT